MVSEVNEEIRAIVSDFDRRQAHEAIGDESVQARALAIDSQHVHLSDADGLAEVAFTGVGRAQTHSFLDEITPSPT